MFSRLLCLSLVVILLQHTLAGFLDGDGAGGFGNDFVTGSFSTEKLIFGLACVKSTATDDMLDITINVKENDETFVYDGGPDDSELVTYEACQFLNVTAYRDSDMRLRMPGDKCKLERLDTSGPISADDVDERTLSATLSVNLNEPENVPCGGVYDGDELSFLIECYRTEDFTKDFGAVVQFQCLNSTAVVTTLNTDASIGSPPQQNVSRYYEVTQNVYWHVSSGPVSTNEEETTVVPGAVELIPNDGAPLGASIYIEVCLKIRDDDRLFFEDGFDPIGVKVGPVVISNVDSVNPILDDYPSSVEVVDSNGCSLYRDPALQLGNETQAIKYLQPDGAESTKFYLRSPNCFRSPEFELVAFVNKNNGLRSINITSTLDYCFDTSMDGGVNMCFGNITSTNDPDDGYTDCSGIGVARKRRQIQDILDELPQTVTTSILIDTGNPTDTEEVTATEEVKDCFERETFIALTACLAFLLAVVMLVAMFLALRIHAAGKDEKGSSISGFSNKGYN